MTYSSPPTAPSTSTTSSSAPNATTTGNSAASPWSAPSPKRCSIKIRSAAPNQTPSTFYPAPRHEHRSSGPSTLAPDRRGPGARRPAPAGQIPQPGFGALVRSQTQNHHQRPG